MPYIEAISQADAYDRLDGLVAVVIVYRRAIAWSDRVLSMACGEFTHCEMFIPNFSGTFVTTIDFGMELKTDLRNNYLHQSENYAWHLVPMTRAEYVRMCAWNMDQVNSHCKYNYRDFVWQVTPYLRPYVHDLTIQDAIHPSRLFCSQAVVLALRAAFSGSDSNVRMRAFANSMNSRLTTPGDLHTAACQYLGISSSNDVVPMGVNEVNMYTNEMINFNKTKRC